jgi:hypothetical protein
MGRILSNLGRQSYRYARKFTPDTLKEQARRHVEVVDNYNYLQQEHRHLLADRNESFAQVESLKTRLAAENELRQRHAVMLEDEKRSRDLLAAKLLAAEENSRIVEELNQSFEKKNVELESERCALRDIIESMMTPNRTSEDAAHDNDMDGNQATEVGPEPLLHTESTVRHLSDRVVLLSKKLAKAERIHQASLVENANMVRDLTRKAEDGQDAISCKICADHIVDTVLSRCGHVFCKGCLDKVTICPTCRMDIGFAERLKIFI